MTKAVCCAAIACCAIAQPRANAEPHRVVLVVWDGMRPDFVTPELTPTLDKLAHDGVRFQNHHSVYPTATDVNGTAIATGVYPSRSGLFANSEFRPAIDPRRPIDAADPASIAAGDAATKGKYLNSPTIAELIRREGRRVTIAGSKAVALLHDRTNTWATAFSDLKSLTIFAGAPITAAGREEMTKLLGPFPVQAIATDRARNVFATRALTDVLWRDGVPDFSLLWLSEPDLSQHDHAPGSPAAREAIRTCDDNLANVLRALDDKHARESTNVLVVSDHGFSTVRRTIDVAELLKASGFRAGKEFSETPQDGDILVVGNGGTILFYVHQHDRAVNERLVEWLQRSDFAGTLFSRDGIAGTFPLSTIHIDTASAVDVVMSFRWTSDKNELGVPGTIDADWNRKVGEGTHATLSPFDTHNTFVAAGPDFRHGFEDNLPTGNIDIAPTVLQLLGVKSDIAFDGRAVHEALHGGKTEISATSETLTAKKPGHEPWEQWLKTSRVGKTIYFDAGLGGAPRK